jgi:hypothetical protein
MVITNSSGSRWRMDGVGIVIVMKSSGDVSRRTEYGESGSCRSVYFFMLCKLINFSRSLLTARCSRSVIGVGVENENEF